MEVGKAQFQDVPLSVTSNKYNTDTYTTCNASALKMNVPFQSKVMRTGAAFWDLTKSYWKHGQINPAWGS